MLADAKEPHPIHFMGSGPTTAKAILMLPNSANRVKIIWVRLFCVGQHVDGLVSI